MQKKLTIFESFGKVNIAAKTIIRQVLPGRASAVQLFRLACRFWKISLLFIFC